MIYPLASPYPRSKKPRRGYHETDRPMIVGFAISFPVSPSAIEVEYRVNEIWSRAELDELVGEDDD